VEIKDAELHVPDVLEEASAASYQKIKITLSERIEKFTSE
jgi:hypothetical protein